MLGKVFKYQMKSVSKILLLIHAGLLALGALIAFVAPKFLFQVHSDFAGFSLSASGSAGVLILTTYLIALVGVLLATYILLAIRFYRNMFTDEAYLTHTLPVKPGTLLLSHILVFCLWFLLSFLLIILSVVFLVAGFGGLENVGELAKLISAYYGTSPFFIVLILLQYCLVGGLATCTMIYLAICIGNLFSPHKIIASVISYLILYGIMQVGSMVVLVLSPMMRKIMFMQMSSPLPPIEFIQTMGWMEVLSLMLAILCWIPSYFITAKHLNLE